MEDNNLFIKWNEVAKDFKGFGLDCDNYYNLSLYKKRLKKAKFKEKYYESWWKRELEPKSRYLFEFVE